MSEILIDSDLCRLPVSARPKEHYRQVFPNVLEGAGKSRVLVIGSGLSNIVLEAGVVAIDPAFADPGKMEVDFLLDPDNFSYWDRAKEVSGFLNRLQEGRGLNRSIVAARAEPGLALPFPRNFFDNIVSSNCIFGGLDAACGPDSTTMIVGSVIKHLTPNGKLHLFPFLSTGPEEIWSNSQEEDAIAYATTYNSQHEILRQLDSLGFKFSFWDTSVRPDRLPKIYQTVVITIDS